MAIFKVITSQDGKSIGHATPKKLEEYLKYMQDENGKTLKDGNGEKISRASALTALNADSDNFSLSCSILAEKMNTCKDYDSLKYKHYVQGFAPEDSELMSEQKCHELGVELAKTFFKDFPVLIVTHCDQKVSGTEDYHWHNHFIVYNCSVKDGHKLNTSRKMLDTLHKFVASQAKENGLISDRGLVIENGELRRSVMPDKITMAERKIQERGQRILDMSEKELTDRIFITQKAELRLAILNAKKYAANLDDYIKYLNDTYGIVVKNTRGKLSYRHPERTSREWIRGESLGQKYSTEAIENGFKESENRSGYLGRNTGAKRGLGEFGAERSAAEAYGSFEDFKRRIEEIRKRYREIFAEYNEASAKSSTRQASGGGNVGGNEEGNIGRTGKHI